MRMPKENRSKEEIKFFYANELEQMFQQLNQQVKRANAKTYKYKTAVRNRALIGVMYFCAMRVSEVTSMEVSDYNVFRNEIYCRRLKNGVNNTLQLVDSFVENALKQHIKINKPKKYMFEIEASDGELRPMSRKTVDAIIRNIGKETTIDREKLHSHTFRHTMAIRLLEDGCSVYDVQYWLGHRCIDNTMIYLSFTSMQQKRLYDQIASKKVRSDYAKMAIR